MFFMTAYEKIMEAGLSMLSRKKMTVFQTHQRLVKIFPNDGAEIRRVLERLQEMDYLNDSSYIQAYARDRMKFRPRGISLIKMELQRKGLSKNLIEEAISQILPVSSASCQENFSTDLDEFSAAQRLATSYVKKSSFLRGGQEQRRHRLKNFLFSKGFSFRTIDSVINSLRKS